jgi:hypothetical protein
VAVHSPTSDSDPSSGTGLLLAGGIGAAIALSLGIYGNAHDPATDLSITLGFADTITMRVWMASIAVLFAIVQLASALWLYGRLPLPDAPPWLGSLHRISGRLAFLASLPVAYHCLYQLAFQDTDTRVLVHSLLGWHVLRGIRGEGGHRPLALAPGRGAADRGRPGLHDPRRRLADERPLVHRGEWRPRALTASRASTASSRR